MDLAPHEEFPSGSSSFWNASCSSFGFEHLLDSPTNGRAGTALALPEESALGFPSGTRAPYEVALAPEVVVRGLRPCRPWREGFGPGSSPWLSREPRAVPSAAGGPRGPALRPPQQQEPDPNPTGSGQPIGHCRPPPGATGPGPSPFPVGVSEAPGAGWEGQSLGKRGALGTPCSHLSGGEHSLFQGRAQEGRTLPSGTP